MNEIQEWLQNLETKGSHECDNKEYVYVYNMVLSHRPYIHEKRLLGSNRCILGSSRNGQGKSCSLEYIYDTGHIRKYLHDSTKQTSHVIMDFDSLHDLLEYEKTSYYPDNYDFVKEYPSYYVMTHVFM